jgi:hypothetical protein
MPVWNRTIDLTGPVQEFNNGGGIETLTKAVVEIVEKSGWLADTPYPDTLRDHLNQLKQAETSGQYIVAFEYIYDVADEDMVWIETS